MHLVRRLHVLLLVLAVAPLLLVAPAQADPIPRDGVSLTGWGADWWGQSTAPASLTGKTVTAISAGYGHSLAVTSDGAITGFGLNSQGQATIPASLTARTATGVAAGYEFSLALTSDGQVTAWGSNSSGQVGVPGSLVGKTVTAVAAGQYHSLALTSDGKVIGWGDNDDGQVNVPTSLDGKTVTAIAAGAYNSLALTSDGVVTAWGYNGSGQGNVPASLAGKTVTAIAAGQWHSLAATSDGQVTAWGSTTEVPASLTGKTVTALAAGFGFSLALTSDGVVTGWGENGAGQTTVASSLTGSTVTAIAAGAYHGLAITGPALVDTGLAGNAVSTVAGTPVTFTPELSGTLDDPAAWTLTDADSAGDVAVTIDHVTGVIGLVSAVVGVHHLTLTIPSEDGDFVASIALTVTPAPAVPTVTKLTVRAGQGLVMRGTRTRMWATGLHPSERYTVKIGRRVAVTGTAGPDGAVNRRVLVPARTAEGRRVVEITGSAPDRVGTTQLHVVRKKRLGLRLGLDFAASTVQASDPQRVRVSRLAPHERVRVTCQGRRISPRDAHANANGVYRMSFGVGTSWGVRTVTVTGQFAGRNATRTFTVVRRVTT